MEHRNAENAVVDAAQASATQFSKAQLSTAQVGANQCAAQSIEFHPALKGALIGSYLLAYLYIQSFFSSRYSVAGYWEFVFVLCFFCAGEVLARRLAKPEPYPKEATFWVLCAIGMGLACALYTFFNTHRPLSWDWIEGHDRGLILVYGRFWLHVVAAYWVVCRFGWLCRRKTSAWLAVDVCNAMVSFPFGNYFLRVKLFWQGIHRLWKQRVSLKIEKKSSGATLAIVGVFGVLFVLALNLLRASDIVFADFLAQFTFQWRWECPLPLWEYWCRFLLSLPVGAYFFSLFARCMQQRNEPSALEKECAVSLCLVRKLRLVSPCILTAVLACFVGLYLLYFGVQAEYYLSAFWGNLPERFTFSEYARQGFFELCKLMTLNFVVLFFVAKVSVTPLRRCKGLRIAATALLVSSLLFAATALAKLVLYIQVYGFTELRLLSAWAIAVLVVAVVLALQTLRKAQPVSAKLIYFAAASFTLLCLVAS